MNDREVDEIVKTVVESIKNENSKEKKELVNNEDFADDYFGAVSPTGIVEPKNKKALENMLTMTTARIGVGRAGNRPLTKTWLRFRGDHAVAQDAVLSMVDESLIDKYQMIKIQTEIENKDEYLTRPDLGRKINQAGKDLLKVQGTIKGQVQIVVADGLSSKAIDANLNDVLPAFKAGLSAKNIKMGTDIFTRYGRVGITDDIGDMLAPEVLVLFIGERPGLGTAESMSAYITYKPTHQTVEADRTVLSNIHQLGTPPAEAGSYLADLVEDILKAQASGIKFKEN